MNDDFEKRLQHLPHRRIPQDWRAEILEQAGHAETQPTKSTTHSWRELIFQYLKKPTGLAWSGVGAAWILILSLNLSARSNDPLIAQEIPSATTLQALQRQKRFLLAELNGIASPAPLIHPKPAINGPRSNRAKETLAA